MRHASLKPVQQWSHARQDRALRDVGQCLRQLDSEETRLHELHHYLDEYESRMTRSQVPASVLLNQHTFLVRLRDAIRFEERRVHDARDAYSRECARWRGTARDSQAMDKLAHTLKSREQQKQERKQQRDLDEFAQRRYGLAQG